MYEFYDFSVASTLPDFVTTKQSKQDLIDVLELDCETLLLDSDPKAVMNLWISQSAATQAIITEVEAMLDSPAMEEIFTKGINTFVVQNGLRDTFETKL